MCLCLFLYVSVFVDLVVVRVSEYRCGWFRRCVLAYVCVGWSLRLLAS